MTFSLLEQALIAQACRIQIKTGLKACQAAIAHEGEIVWSGSFGTASDSSRFWVASATKPVLSSALLQLIANGQLDVSKPVADYLEDEFGDADKQGITVEQVMVMTSGLHNAEMTLDQGDDPVTRRAVMTGWKPETPPGSYYEYHSYSSHWVQAELIERLASGNPTFDAFLEQEITDSLGLPRLLRIAPGVQTDIVQLDDPDTPPATKTEISRKIEVGEPGGGIAARAEDMALFYQGLLHNPNGTWDPAALADGIGNVRNVLPHEGFGLPANRTLLAVLGMGFGSVTPLSPTAFGWPGAGGQVAYMDPQTGISFSFLQHGDPGETSQFIRAASMANLVVMLAGS